MSQIKLLLLLTENWTMIDPRDLPAQVDLAVQAEKAGFDGVMVSDHIVLGVGADAEGLPANPRAFAGPGNQSPDTPWASNTVLMAALAQATERVRVIAGAVIAPLRHPLLLAKEFATLDLLSNGRMVMLPTVSWHKAEYDALGVPFNRRGAVLDEQLAILHAAWNTPAGQPISFHGEFFNFDDVWVEPKSPTAGGTTMWFGGDKAHAKTLNRLVRYGKGFLGVTGATPDDRAAISAALAQAGRTDAEIEIIGGLPPTFPDNHSCSILDHSLMAIEPQMATGVRTFVVKPSLFLDSTEHFQEFAEEIVSKANAIAKAFDERNAA